MPYTLGQGETEDRALQRCAAEQLERAIGELTETIKTDPVTAVHEARKALKMERSLLRLGRSALSSSERRRMNAALRDAGRSLSPARDAEVMIQAVDDLAEHYTGQLPRKTFTAIKQHLDRQAEGARASLAGPQPAAGVIEELKALRLQVDGWRLRRAGWRALGDGLARSYARGRRAYRRASAKPTVENLHEWRKRGKDLWYHVRLLEPTSPGIMHGAAQEAHHLSNLLGDDHDLAVLRASLVADGGDLAVDLDSVIALIDHRREQLQSEAMLVGARLYAETPKAFVRRVHSYWTVWHAPPEAGEARTPVRLAGRARAATAAA